MARSLPRDNFLGKFEFCRQTIQAQALRCHNSPMAKMLKSPPRPQYRRTFIGEWIDHVGKTQRAVAAAAEISEPHMSLVIRGRRQYTQELLERIAAAIDPDIEPPMLLYPPTSKSMWGIWRDLSPEQRDQAVAMAEILRKKG